MNSKNIAIRVENISKRYRIGLKEDMHDSVGSAISDFIKRPWKNYRKYRSLYRFNEVTPDSNETQVKDDASIIWAVRDVSFAVNRGEVVGIIGGNGAGKSTLLKLLCKITDPTSGQAEIRGRVSSLLEVGTGFHPELTGKENIYLNGTILGMRKYEIDHKIDEIIEFSGVEKFIDTPVKRYSSGMRVRLAFAVAASLEPEILLIDEVLAVGDANFQKRCLNKMQDVSQEGRTILFVSHNMAAITRLCSRTILLDNGRVISDGPSREAVSLYLNAGTGTTASREWPDLANAPGNDIVRLRAVRIKSENGQVEESMDIRRPIGIEMVFDVLKPDEILLPYYSVFNGDDIRALSAVEQTAEWLERPRPLGRYKSIAWIPGNLLSEGMFTVGAAMRSPNPKIKYFNEKQAVSFQVIDSLDGDTARGSFSGKMSSVIRPLLKWETDFSPKDGG